MSNLCNYIMKIVGTEENVDEFVSILQAEYDYNVEPPQCEHKHFWRLFNVDVIDEEELDSRYHAKTVSGDCAWSVYSCMFSGEHTYQGSYEGDTRYNGTDILTESKNLNLSVEIYSSEPGIGFQEHFLIDKGDIIKSECEDYHELSTEWFNNPREICEELQSEYSEADIQYNLSEDDDNVSFGGVDNYGQFTI